jgi:putative ABC transport system permease protein
MSKIGPALYLALRYLRQHPLQTALLAGTLSLLLSLPLVIRILLHETEHRLHQRALATPLVLGARASALDLVLSSLHFRLPPPPPITLADAREAARIGLASVIPLHLGHHAQGAPIVGTELDYFTLRRLALSGGTPFLRLGDCVLGARLAQSRHLRPGDSLISSPTQAFDLAGAYPLKMRITGVLAPSGTPDDDAAFVDLKTAWLIDGLAHGHDDLSKAASDQILTQNGSNVVGNASVRLYNEVTPKNVASFHFHGDSQKYPLTAALVFPHDAKSDALLSGRYQEKKTAQSLQLITPETWITSLMTTLFRLESLILILLIATGTAGLLIITLVFTLSFRLRRREFQTLADLGVAPASLFSVKLFEILLVFLLATALTALTLPAAQWAAPHLVRSLIH